MFEQSWPIELKEPPKILQLGVGVHGNVAIERYLLDFWCMHFYQYVGEVWLDEVRYSIRPGYVSIVPPGVRLEYHFSGRAIHLYSHFRCPPPRSEHTSVGVPAMQDLGTDFALLNQALEQAVGYWVRQPERARARVWDLLWQLSERASVPLQEDWHPALEQALRFIEVHFSEPLRVGEIAREIGISHNHLTRLFRTKLNKTVSGYIQERRIERARYLLQSSERPITSIALEVGIADLHLFNKTIRRALGRSPREVRARARLEPPRASE